MKTVEQRTTELDQVLDDFEQSNGLPYYQFAEGMEEAKEILAMTPSELRGLTATQCGEAAVSLQQYAFYIQRVVNRERTRANWAEENLTVIFAKHATQIPKEIPWAERRAYATRLDGAAMKFDAIRVESQTKINRLDFYAAKIDAVARALIALQQSKKGYRE